MENIINSLLVNCLRDDEWTLHIKYINDSYDNTIIQYEIKYDNVLIIQFTETIILEDDETISYTYKFLDGSLFLDTPLINRDLVNIITKFYEQCQ